MSHNLGVGGRPDNTDPVTDEDGHTTFLDSILDNVTSGISNSVFPFKDCYSALSFCEVLITPFPICAEL